MIGIKKNKDKEILKELKDINSGIYENSQLSQSLYEKLELTNMLLQDILNELISVNKNIKQCKKVETSETQVPTTETDNNQIQPVETTETEVPTSENTYISVFSDNVEIHDIIRVPINTTDLNIKVETDYKNYIIEMLSDNRELVPSSYSYKENGEYTILVGYGYAPSTINILHNRNVIKSFRVEFSIDNGSYDETDNNQIQPVETSETQVPTTETQPVEEKYLRVYDGRWEKILLNDKMYYSNNYPFIILEIETNHENISVVHSFKDKENPFSPHYNTFELFENLANKKTSK